MARVQVIRQVRQGEQGDWNLCFQWCQFNYDDGTSQRGYRFIWRRENGNLQAARGQARIPDAATLENLIQRATEEGWYRRIEQS